jgi:hypothetical protein
MTTERAPPGGLRTRRTQDLVAAAEGHVPSAATTCHRQAACSLHYAPL